jgi:GntR family transcriptional regulator
MLIVVDPHSGVPVYRQLMDQIKLHVASGLLKPGDELPSTRALSSELGVNPMTISKAYSFLERDDIVERRPGRPLVVKTVTGGVIRDRRVEELRKSLAPTVTMVKQLGLSDEEAVRAFADLLESTREPGEGSGDEPRPDDPDNGTTDEEVSRA